MNELNQTTIKIGTRGSKLALWQAYYVEKFLKKRGLSTEIVVIDTKGDKILDRSLAKIGSKGVFTEELEEQLRSGHIHIAVHSAKDLQSSLDDDFSIIAFTPREKVNDVLVSHKSAINVHSGKKFVVGTSSVRRVALLKHYLPHLEVVSVRGNLQTRMRKMEEGLCDALMLAYAGVHRMDYSDAIRHTFSVETFTPPVGQGTIAVEASNQLPSPLAQAIRHALNHPETESQMLAERAFLKKLEGGCSIPAFAHAELSFNKKKLTIYGGLVHVEGHPLLRQEVEGPIEKASQIGRNLAEKLLSAGGSELLDEIRQL